MVLDKFYSRIEFYTAHKLNVSLYAKGYRIQCSEYWFMSGVFDQVYTGAISYFLRKTYRGRQNMERSTSFTDLKIERHHFLPFNCAAGVVKIVCNQSQELNSVILFFNFPKVKLNK